MDRQDNTTCCSSGEEVYISYVERQVIAAVIIIFSIAGTIGNLLVIAAVIVSRKLRHTTNMFVLNLSIADLLICVSGIPTEAVAILNEDNWPLPMAVCTIAAFLLILCFGCCINNLTGIAISRYIVVTKNKTTHQRLFRRRWILTALILTWLIPTCVIIILKFTGCVKLGYEPQYSLCGWVSTNSFKFSITLFATFLPTQFLLILWSYMKVFRHVYTHTKRVRHLDDSIKLAVVGQQAWQPPKRADKLQVEVTKNLFYCMCSFVLCLAPFGICLMIPNAKKWIPITVAILIGNSCVNPIIYAAKHPHFRVVFCCIICGKFSEIPERISLRFCN